MAKIMILKTPINGEESKADVNYKTAETVKC
jgi:hypothetical protein